MKIVTLFLVLLLSACTSNVNKTELIESLNERMGSKRSHINIVWYEGTKDGYHYLAHVYEMFGTKKYKVSVNELMIKDEIPLTSDSQNWVRISNISDKWLASRKNYETNEWSREDEGLHLK